MKIAVIGSDLICDQVAIALESLGHEVIYRHGRPDPAVHDYEFSLEQLQAIVDDPALDMIFTRNNRVFQYSFNRQGPELLAYLLEQKIPHVMWHVENPFVAGNLHSSFSYRTPPTDNGLALHFCFSKGITAQLQENGYNAQYLPIGVTPSWFPVSDDQVELYDVGLIARPKLVFGKKFEKIPYQYMAVESAYRQFNKRFTTQLLNDILPKFLNHIFSPCCDELFFYYDSGHNPLFQSLEIKKGAIGSRMLHVLGLSYDIWFARAVLWNMVEKISELPIQFFIGGGVMWESRFPAVIGGDEVPYREQSVLYGKCGINLATCKYELGDTIHERIFNIAGSKNFVLAEHRSAIREFFTEDEVPTFSNAKEMKEKILYYRERPEVRKACAEAVHKKVMKDHTMERRMEQMLEVAKSHHIKRAPA